MASSLTIYTTSDGSHTLYDKELDEHYHSTKGALQESNYVFIETGLFSALGSSHQLNVLEVGLGTGLNAVLTAIESEQRKVRIHYQAIEPYPIAASTAQELNFNDRISENAAAIFDQLLTASPNQLVRINDYFSFKWFQSTLEAINLEDDFDLVYFDAFAPSKQPEIWESLWLAKVVNAMKPAGIFATYCAKGQVRRDLMAAGLNIERLQGPPGGKREMLRGTKQSS